MGRASLTSAHSTLCGLTLLILVALAGCGPGGPKTYPVKGKVVFEKGGDLSRLVGRSVELESTSEPDTRGFGKIQSDGTFNVESYREGVSLKGAIGGTHRARILIDASDEEGRPKKRAPLDPKFTRFDTSGWQITVPTEAEVILKVH